MKVVIGLLHGATFLSGFLLVLFVSFIGPWQLERTPIKPHLQLQLQLIGNRGVVNLFWIFPVLISS